MQIETIMKTQRAYFASHETYDIDFRIASLKALRQAIKCHEADISLALKTDLGKSETEGYMCEIGLTLSEITYQIKHIRKWARNTWHPTSLVNFHAKSFSVYQPYGSVLIMSPWNYPFMLCMEPLAGALAAGNCCVLKPSAYSPATSAVIKQIIEEIFPPEYVAVVEGGRQENQALLDQNFDYILFTGGATVGREVMQKAAKNLTPVTLELGGKSPCIITDTCNVKVAAARLVFGKFLNCGQTCVAPDYCLVDKKIKDTFLEHVQLQITKMFGEKPLENPNYGKIINEKHFERISGLIAPEKVLIGGQCNPQTLQIAPTVLNNVTPEDAVMQEEIFGPLLPVLTYQTIEEAEAFIQKREKPLALYLFTQDKSIEERFLKYVSFGGGCVNDTIVHLSSPEMGFGGVGHSGMGSYHGRKSFETFSHEKSILKKYNWIDLPMRYQPYKALYLKLIKLFLH
ncbi:MAG: aldehyde dehydrogenase [Lachnospiraceae bacterium]|nr:aldehyde dehydrogenase [Lachnospiraceae bacterium]